MAEQHFPPGAEVRKPDVTGDKTFIARDPGLNRDCENVIAGLKNDLIPHDIQEALFAAMNSAVQRNIVASTSGLDASILMTFKQQLSLVDSILRRTYNSDGSLSGSAEEIGMNPKDVLNLSFKVSQMMTKELPKVYSMDRVQKMEKALLEVMSKELTREQQEKFLVELENTKGAL